MRIKQVDISGFKSFCEPTRVVFGHAVTGVVGPNGCGKSNIVDAIRWALGEQSAKNLRGKGMEDVIFNGSATRGPQSVADVTITFRNDDGLSHPAYIDYPEVSVTRRLHRDGTSEYLINKIPCRLKDVTELFLGTGGGARAYSIIEQGRIGLIVSSRSEDRRAMIEEAAGITRYKSARRLATRKMEQTRQHLLRVTDVVAEMERNLSSLKRQAAKAARFKKHRAEQRDHELYLASHRFLELLTRTKVVDASLAQAEDDQRDARAQHELIEAQVESLRLEEHAARTELDAGKAVTFESDNAIQVAESEIRHLEETLGRLRHEEREIDGQEDESLAQLQQLEGDRRGAESQVEELERRAAQAAGERAAAERAADEGRERLAKLGAEYDEQRDRLSRSRARRAAAGSAVENLEKRITEAEERLELTRAEQREIQAAATELEATAQRATEHATAVEAALSSAVGTIESESEAFEELRGRLDEADLERQLVRDELRGKQSRLDSLTELHQSLERHDRAVRDAVVTLRVEGETPFAGLLIDFVKCEQEYEQALAAALDQRLQALVAEDHDAGVELLTWLKQRDLGRVTVLARAGVPRPERPLLGFDDPAVLGRLGDFLEIDPTVADLVADLLEDVFVVQDIESATRLWNDHPGRATLVTRDGQLLQASGVMCGGRAGSPGADLLGQQRQIRELALEVEAEQARHAELEELFAKLKAELLERRNAADEARQRAQQQEILLAEARKDRTRADEELRALRERLVALEREATHQADLLEQTRADCEQAAAEAEEADAEIRRLELWLLDAQGAIERCGGDAERLAAAASDARVREVELRQQHQATVERSCQIATTLEQLGQRIGRFVGQRREHAEQIGRVAGRIVEQRDILARHLDEAERSRGRVRDLGDALAHAGASLADAERELREQRREIEAAGAQVADLRMEAQEAKLDITHLLESIADRHDIDLRRVIGDYHMRPIPGADVKERIEELKRLIDRMGPINPAAIEEYEATQERYEEKTKHKADVEQALEDLERTISRMDKDSRRLFEETFTNVNARFQEIFPRLFKGGRAHLALTDPDDLLSTGVDIVAQPPGKRLGNIELMSGGEKALTAVSLLFAIFLHRPSPFCLLDEVDAPLDEANVGRFVEMVREMTKRSQFVLITHSKVTMEGSDVLYGVTMQEPGVSKMVSVRLVKEVQAQAVNE